MPIGYVVSVNTYCAQGLTQEDLETDNYGQVISANLLTDDDNHLYRVSQNSFVDTNDWFNLRFGLAVEFEVHQGNARQARVRWIQPMEEIDIEEDDPPAPDAMSDYSSDTDSFDSDSEFTSQRGRKTSKVFPTYQQQKHQPHFKINTPEGLKQSVTRFDTGKNSGANTHALYKAEDDDSYKLYQKGTALGVKLFAARFKNKATQERIKVNVKNAQAQWGKKKNVHTEMHLLWLLTQGDASKIRGVMRGGKLVVDKPICRDCYPFVQLAEPAVIRDGFEGSLEQRERWDTWVNPFNT